MADQIQGKDVTLKVYVNGKVIRGFPVRNFDDEAKQEVRERDLVGETRTQTQLLVHGYKGTIEFDVDSARHHELAEYLNTSDKSGAPSYELAIQVCENYRDGSRKRYRYVRCTFMIPSKSTRGRKEDVTGKMEWHAEDRVYLK